MQAKLKNVNGFTGFLLAHGEKVGIAAVIVVAGLLVWKSLGREKLGEDKQPPRLEAQAQDADRKVREVTFESLREQNEATVADEIILDASASVLTPIAGEAFPNMKQALDPRVIAPMVPRTDPLVLPPVEPEAYGMSGLVLSGDEEALNQKRLAALAKQQQDAIQAEKEREEQERLAEEEGRRGRRGRDEGLEGDMFAGGLGGMNGSKTRDGAIVVSSGSNDGMQADSIQDIRAESWVSVVAKIPIEQQYQMYADALENARGYSQQTDVPLYIAYEVERAEVTDKGDGPWTSIARIGKRAVEMELSKWPIQTPELADPKYVHPFLTWPLLPMVIRPWDERITHSDLPLPTPESMYEDMMEQTAPEQEPAEGAEEQDAFERAADRALERNNPNAASPYGGMESRMYGGAAGMEGGILPRQMMMGGEPGMRSMGGSAGVNAESGVMELPDYPGWDYKTEFLLFRYFDRNVEPGQRYRYRIRLALVDVNANQAEAFLDPTVIERKQKSKLRYFLTDWSEPSSVATVPQPGLIYLAGAKPASAGNLNAEPEAEVVVKSLDPQLPAEVALSRFYTRGSVINSRERAQVIWSSTYDFEEMPESPAFDFVTGLTLLDFEGGEPLGSRAAKMQAPARALVMNPSGRLMLQDELDDQSTAREFKMIVEQAKQAASQNRDEPERGRGRGRDRGFR
jgi:hypothetical protein